MYVLTHFRPEPAFLAGEQKSSFIGASPEPFNFETVEQPRIKSKPRKAFQTLRDFVETRGTNI
jgi:hypothetical protein